MILSLEEKVELLGTLLAKRTEQWIEDGNPVVFYRASSLYNMKFLQKVPKKIVLLVGYLEDFLLSVADTIFLAQTNASILSLML